MSMPSRRVLNFTGFIACAGMMGFALYAQYGLQLDPCPLCVLQRVAVIGLGVVFFLAAIHGPLGWGRQIYAVFLAIFALPGSGVAAWHVRLQNLPADQVPACGPGLDYMLENFPLADALRMVFKGSGECAEVVWQFLGLSMPAWVLICVLGLGGLGVWNNLRTAR
ncbi:MAG: disulfide bond formation protein B [Gammaproteobacteria bacterium]|nr:disulfide bond formation protein B [Gammaproteobacteria bacterium]